MAMKKLKLDELHVDSFSTTGIPAERGTVMGLNTAVGGSCDTWCETEANRTSCSPAQCTDTGSGQSLYCASVVNCSTAPACHPYGMSNDWTFCQTECCDSNAYTCYDYSCTCGC